MFSPFPVSDTKIPTPFSASTSISLLFLTSPESFAYIPIDFLAVDVIAILALFVAVETSLFEFFPSANIPIPFSAIKLIVFLFITSEAACPNIPTDSRVFTCIVPSLIPVAFSLASIPIFLSSVAVVDSKLITPPVLFVAITLSFAIVAELLVTIIPTASLVLIFISPLFSKSNLEVATVVAASIRPNIPADFVPLIIIFPVFFAATFLFPIVSSNFTEIPADAVPIAVIVPLLITVPILESE